MFTRTTVLVTGGAGFVGARLVPRLLAAGHRVRVLDRFLYGDEPLSDLRSHSGLHCVRGDVRDSNAVAEALEGSEQVVHLASISDVESFDLDPALARSINLDGLATVVRQASRAGVLGFLHLTSTDVYGTPAGLVTETAKLVPQSALARCEIACESLVHGTLARGLAAATLRVAPLAGWSPRMRFDLPVNDFAVRGFFLRETQHRSFESLSHAVHVDDLVELLARMLRWPVDVWEGQVFNVVGRGLRDSHSSHSSHPSALPPAAFVDSHAATLDLPSSFPSDLPSHSGLSLEQTLGWRPSRAADLALREVVERLGHGEFSDALTNPRYSNAESLRRLDRGELRRAA
ncbi:MAG: SDR family oxidoreductase [Planctomycetota bacterium]|nr:SDR family oxidoreductase [Planctomycetota bacterium]